MPEGRLRGTLSRQFLSAPSSGLRPPSPPRGEGTRSPFQIGKLFRTRNKVSVGRARRGKSGHLVPPHRTSQFGRCSASKQQVSAFPSRIRMPTLCQTRRKSLSGRINRTRQSATLGNMVAPGISTEAPHRTSSFPRRRESQNHALGKSAGFPPARE